MGLLGCSTTPSVTLLTPPQIDIKALKAKPPADLLTKCEELLKYHSNDVREVVKVTVTNHNLYYNCASKLDALIKYIDSG